eukprot:401890-Rhodomonas_salina.1
MVCGVRVRDGLCGREDGAEVNLGADIELVGQACEVLVLVRRLHRQHLTSTCVSSFGMPSGNTFCTCCLSPPRVHRARR